MIIRSKGTLGLNICQRHNDYYIEDILGSPHLSDPQIIELLTDYYSESQICPFGDQKEHNTVMAISKNRRKSGTTSSILLGKCGKRFNQEMLHIIVEGILVDEEDSEYLILSTEDTKNSRTQEFDSLCLLLNNPNLSSSDFKNIFLTLIPVIDGHFKYKRNKTVNPAFKNIMLNMINLKHFDRKEILSLCYNSHKWFREMVIEMPDCPKEGKVIVSLLNGGEKLAYIS